MHISTTLHHLKELGLDSERAHKTALKLYAHSVLLEHKLITTRRPPCSRGLGMEQGAASQIPTSFLFSLVLL